MVVEQPAAAVAAAGHEPTPGAVAHGVDHDGGQPGQGAVHPGRPRVEAPAARGVEAGLEQGRAEGLVEAADGGLVDGQTGVGPGQLAQAAADGQDPLQVGVADQGVPAEQAVPGQPDLQLARPGRLLDLALQVEGVAEVLHQRERLRGRLAASRLLLAGRAGHAHRLPIAGPTRQPRPAWTGPRWPVGYLVGHRPPGGTGRPPRRGPESPGGPHASTGRTLAWTPPSICWISNWPASVSPGPGHALGVRQGRPRTTRPGEPRPAPSPKREASRLPPPSPTSGSGPCVAGLAPKAGSVLAVQALPGHRHHPKKTMAAIRPCCCGPQPDPGAGGGRGPHPAGVPPAAPGPG